MDFQQRFDAIKQRLKKATTWKASDREPATEEWLKNREANAELCHNAYADLAFLLEAVNLQKLTLYHVHGLLSDDYFENWEECLMEIENVEVDINDLIKAEQ